MKLSDLGNFLNIENGQHTTNVYIPSIKRDIEIKATIHIIETPIIPKFQNK